MRQDCVHFRQARERLDAWHDGKGGLYHDPAAPCYRCGGPLVPFGGILTATLYYCDRCWQEDEAREQHERTQPADADSIEQARAKRLAEIEACGPGCLLWWWKERRKLLPRRKSRRPRPRPGGGR